MAGEQNTVSFYSVGSNAQFVDLSERQELILRAIVQHYILSATPVGSRTLSKILERDLNLSAATIRNVMADLEEMGFVAHPHTSAGRVPTDKGYRYYVDSLTTGDSLSIGEQRSIRDNLTNASRETVLRSASRILGALSHYLGIVEIPYLSDAIVRKIETVPLSSSRMIVVVTLGSDVVRTITLESNFEVKPNDLDEVTRRLNERISGKTLGFVRGNLPEVMSEVETGNPALMRLFIDSAESLFQRRMMPGDKVHIAGTQGLLEHPEFENTERFKSIIELIESEEVIVHLLEGTDAVEGRVNVLIGRELERSSMDDYSLLTTRYRFSSAVGTIGLIGPKRMNYSKMISILQNVAQALSVQ